MVHSVQIWIADLGRIFSVTSLMCLLVLFCKIWQKVEWFVY